MVAFYVVIVVLAAASSLMTLILEKPDLTVAGPGNVTRSRRPSGRQAEEGFGDEVEVGAAEDILASNKRQLGSRNREVT
jgi:hypothetical protein